MRYVRTRSSAAGLTDTLVVHTNHEDRTPGGTRLNGRRFPTTRFNTAMIQTATLRDAMVRAGLLLILGALLPGQVQTSSPSSDELNGMSLEQLTQITVSSVSRRNQQLSRVAAAAYIITEEDIRRSGATSIPELLRRVPGLQVARIDSSKWAVSSRGFNGRFSNKMLVLIDGRSIYNNEDSAVYWENNDIFLENVERIEIIRGPGATMWGANAVNGVINVITKKASATQGGLVLLSGGGDEKGSGAVRYGGTAGKTVSYRGYTKFSQRRRFLDSSNRPAHDKWDSVRGGGRLDWNPTERDQVSFWGDLHHGTAEQSMKTLWMIPGMALAEDHIRTSGGFGMGRWEHTLRSSTVALQGYYSAEHRAEWIATGTMRTVDLDFQQSLTWKDRHDLVWGAGYRQFRDVVVGPNPPLQPPSRTNHLTNVFLQDDFSVIPDRLVVTLGSKILHNSYTGVEVQPGARLMWTPSRRQSYWAAISRAVRTPSRRDRDLVLDFPAPQQGPLPTVLQLRGNPSFQSETVLAYEAGYRAQIGKRFSLDVASFVNRYDHLEVVLHSSPIVRQEYGSSLMIIPIIFANGAHGNSRGIETTLSWDPSKRWRLQAGHAWIDGRFHGMTDGGTDSYQRTNWLVPKNTFSLHSSLDVTRRLSFDSTVYYVSRLPYRDVGQYARIDSRIIWKIGESGELSGGFQNMQSPRHLEYSMEEYTAVSQVPRTADLRFRWQF